MTPEQYFNRQIQLWGGATQKALQNKKIAIIGSGGLGCTLAMALGTSGIGEIHMVDFDTVSNHNIHRQIAFTLQDEGKNKAKAVAALIESKNPFVKALHVWGQIKQNLRQACPTVNQGWGHQYV